MNSTPDEGESFLRDQVQDSQKGRTEKDAEAHDDQDVPELAPEVQPSGDGAVDVEDAEDELELELEHTAEDAQRDTTVVELGTNGVADAVLSEDTNHAPSFDDSVSTPDDTPSIQGSILSSPGSDAGSLRSPARRGSPSIPHRPFDIRFQSRLSSSNISPLRASSPAFLGSHSRHSSTASAGFQTPSEPDENINPWDVLRWTRFRKITGQTFSEVGRRNFGSPTCLAVADQLVLGTSKGLVLVFDHHQNHKAIIGSGTKAAESGAVTSLAISADHTTVAVGHATGHIFTWEVARPSRPFLHIPPIEDSQPQARRGDGHITGSAVPHIGFLGYRHTALVSADDKGMAFSHLATRGMGAVSRVVRTTRILGRYPEVISRNSKPQKKSSVLAFSPLPLGNIEQRTDGLGLVAMLTPYLLVIVSTTPVAQTQHKAARPKEVAAHSAMTAALAWFPAIKLKSEDSQTSRTKLVYAWSNILTVLEVHQAPIEDETEKDKPPELQFLARSRYQSEEAIVAVQWLNKSVLAVLTITQQLLIIEDFTMHVTEAFDLLKKNVYHADLYSQQLRAIIEQLDEEDISMHGVVADAFHMSFRAYKGRLFLLGFNDIWTGALTNWADRLLAMINVGDFIGAIRLAARYYQGEGEKATIGLPEEDSTRASLVKEKLIEMMTASLKYAFGKNQQAGTGQIEKPQMVELADACIKACLDMDDQDFLFEDVFSWYEEHEQGALFVDVLEPYILDRRIVSVPPPALKTLINHFAQTHSPSVLEEIICMLDTSTMDIDQVTSLCKRHGLYDAYIYVWTLALRDFTTPLVILLDFADGEEPLHQQAVSAIDRYGLAQKIFPYVSFILTSRVYPTGTLMSDEDAAQAKSQVYDFFFSGGSKPNGVSNRRSNSSTLPAASFEHLSRILQFDTASFIAALNEAFEDSYLNSGDDEAAYSLATGQAATTRTYTRQYLVRILLEVMSSTFEADDTIYLDMFVARNLAKYPQYMVLSGTVLQEIFSRLCHYPDDSMREDAQLSIEYLLSIYQPPNVLEMVPLLREARFHRVLKSVFRQEHEYPDMISTYFLDSDDQDGVFDAIVECLRTQSSLVDAQRQGVRQVVQQHALDLVTIDVRKSAGMIDAVAPEMHPDFLQVLSDDTFAQYEYLRALLEPDDRLRPAQKYGHAMMELYVRLLCQFDATHVRDYVESVKEGDIRLTEVLPTIEDSGIIDAVVILQVRQGHVKDAMSRLNIHLSFLGSTLKDLTEGSSDPTDSGSIHHASTGVLEALEKYVRVGIWLCQGQMKMAPKPLTVSKSPRRSTSASRALSFEENLWLEFILCVVGIAREMSVQNSLDAKPKRTGTDADIETTSALRTMIQQVFTALLASTASIRDGGGGRDMVFLRILRAFLSHAAEASPSLAELRNVLSSIFSAYAYEESLLALSNAMLDKDVFVHLDEVTALRLQGWRPRGQVCEVCRRRVWGPGTGEAVWEQWRKSEDGRLTRRRRVQEIGPTEEDEGARGKGKASIAISSQSQPEAESPSTPSGLAEEVGPVAVFSCRHLYHQRCLGPAPVEDGVPQLMCPACV